MVNVSDFIPQGYPVVVSHPHSYLKYFINHDIVTSLKKYPQKSYFFLLF
jgi:hypothetical protein